MATAPRLIFVLCFLIPSLALASALTVLAQSPSEVTAQLDVDPPSTADVIADGETYTQLRIAGLESSAAGGEPEIPYLRAMVYVPAGTAPRLELVKSEPPEGIRLPHPLAFTYRLPVHSLKPVYAKRNPASYARIIGGSPVVIENVSYAGPDKIATVRFTPVRYDGPHNRLQWIRSLRVRFRFVPSRGTPPVAGDGIARYVVINPESVPAAKTAARASVDLIIAHTSHKETLARYIKFKRQISREVREYYVEDKSASEIKEIIRAEYAGAVPPTGTLLVGSLEQIPSFRGSSDNTWSDFKFTTLDDGSQPDLALGRVPAEDAAELNAFIDKAIARETGPRNVDEILMTAGKDTSLGCPQNVTRVGENLATSGDHVNVTERFRLNVSTQEIIDGYNASPNLIVYDGHGDRRGMSEVPLLMSQLDKLSNKVFPILLDIACLNANWSKSAGYQNFARSILLAPGVGVAGILASGGSGMGHEFFRNIGQIMADGRRNAATDPRMNEIGQVILAAKVKGDSEDRNFWNYYGDPASSVWETRIPVKQ